MTALANVDLSHFRTLVVDVLTDAYANNRISIEEFDKRVELAHQLEDKEKLELLIGGMGLENELKSMMMAQSDGSQNPGTALQKVDHNPEKLVAILGNIKREGAWQPKEEMSVSVYFGSGKIDFRDTAFMHLSHIRLKAFVVMGTLDIHVPDTMKVRCEGSGILGQFHLENRAGKNIEDEPQLELTVHGKVVGGHVLVRVFRTDDPFLGAKMLFRKWANKLLE